jgi:hypothetical protein
VFVKTADLKVAEESGIKRFPALVYFEKGVPSIYDGELSSEEDVLQWLILQKTEDTIESVNRELLEQMIESSHYLVAFFCELRFCCKILSLSLFRSMIEQINLIAGPVTSSSKN